MLIFMFFLPTIILLTPVAIVALYKKVETKKGYPTNEDWLRMYKEPGWSREKENIEAEKDWLQTTKNFMNKDLKNLWQEYM